MTIFLRSARILILVTLSFFAVAVRGGLPFPKEPALREIVQRSSVILVGDIDALYRIAQRSDGTQQMLDARQDFTDNVDLYVARVAIKDVLKCETSCPESHLFVELLIGGITKEQAPNLYMNKPFLFLLKRSGIPENQLPRELKDQWLAQPSIPGSEYIIPTERTKEIVHLMGGTASNK